MLWLEDAVPQLLRGVCALKLFLYLKYTELSGKNDLLLEMGWDLC